MSVSYGNVWFGTEYHGTPLRARWGKHSCASCGNCIELVRKTVKGTDHKHAWKEFKCLKCGNEIKTFTQISYESHKKYIKNIYNELLKYVKPEQIKSVWLDKDGNISDKMPIIENAKSFSFSIKLNNNTEFVIPCTTTEIKNTWERPLILTKDKAFNTAIKNFKKNIKTIPSI